MKTTRELGKAQSGDILCDDNFHHVFIVLSVRCRQSLRLAVSGSKNVIMYDFTLLNTEGNVTAIAYHFEEMSGWQFLICEDNKLNASSKAK